VASWQAAAKVVVVHCGQIIVYEGIGMHHFNGGGGDLGVVIGPAGYEFAAPQYERRAKAFARGGKCVGECFFQLAFYLTGG
jgi:hypothetical protein